MLFFENDVNAGKGAQKQKTRYPSFRENLETDALPKMQVLGDMIVCHLTKTGFAPNPKQSVHVNQLNRPAVNPEQARPFNVVKNRFFLLRRCHLKTLKIFQNIFQSNVIL